MKSEILMFLIVVVLTIFYSMFVCEKTKIVNNVENKQNKCVGELERCNEDNRRADR